MKERKKKKRKKKRKKDLMSKYGDLVRKHVAAFSEIFKKQLS